MLPEVKKIRVEFSKTGALKYISHLDLNRTMQNVFLRSKLPIVYSQGFNPHPKTVFSPPLSVGVSSECEFIDFKMTEDVPYDVICRRLNESFPEGLRALSAYEPESKFSDIGWADYEIAFETPAAIVVFATSSTVALRRNAVAMNASGESPCFPAMPSIVSLKSRQNPPTKRTVFVSEPTAAETKYAAILSFFLVIARKTSPGRSPASILGTKQIITV